MTTLPIYLYSQAHFSPFPLLVLRPVSWIMSPTPFTRSISRPEAGVDEVTPHPWWISSPYLFADVLIAVNSFESLGSGCIQVISALGSGCIQVMVKVTGQCLYASVKCARLFFHLNLRISQINFPSWPGPQQRTKTLRRSRILWGSELRKENLFNAIWPI